MFEVLPFEHVECPVLLCLREADDTFAKLSSVSPLTLNENAYFLHADGIIAESILHCKNLYQFCKDYKRIASALVV